jgi:hypothetical protein
VSSARQGKLAGEVAEEEVEEDGRNRSSGMLQRIVTLGRGHSA